MKHVFKFIIMILVALNFIGCSKDDNLNQVTNNSITVTPKITSSLDLSSTQVPTISLAPTELQGEVIDSNLYEYQLCGLSINATEKKIIDIIGKPKYSLNYYIEDGAAWSELRCMMEYDGLMIRTGKQLKMSVDDEDGEYLLSEIDIYTPEYTTYRGIKVGDSIDMVKKQYNKIQNFSLLDVDKSLKGDMIYDMLTRKNRPKLNGEPEYVSDFNYGEFEKFGYIYYLDEKNLGSRPALIFLFHDDIVTHIILYNWFYEIAG